MAAPYGQRTSISSLLPSRPASDPFVPHRVEFFVRERAIFSGLREKFGASLIVIITAQDYVDR